MVTGEQSSSMNKGLCCCAQVSEFKPHQGRLIIYSVLTAIGQAWGTLSLMKWVALID